MLSGLELVDNNQEKKGEGTKQRGIAFWESITFSHVLCHAYFNLELGYGGVLYVCWATNPNVEYIASAGTGGFGAEVNPSAVSYCLMSLGSTSPQLTLKVLELLSLPEPLVLRRRMVYISSCGSLSLSGPEGEEESACTLLLGRDNLAESPTSVGSDL